jgi:hypothetical protein
VLRKPLKEQLKNVIDGALLHSVTKSQFQKQLHEKEVQVIFRQNEEGRLYGVTFVDLKSKVVFNGSDLGKQYSAALLPSRLKNCESLNNQPVLDTKNNTPFKIKTIDHISEYGTGNNTDVLLLDILYKEEQQDMSAIGRLQQRKRKKKRKGHSL